MKKRIIKSITLCVLVLCAGVFCFNNINIGSTSAQVFSTFSCTNTFYVDEVPTSQVTTTGTTAKPTETTADSAGGGAEKPSAGDGSDVPTQEKTQTQTEQTQKEKTKKEQTSAHKNESKISPPTGADASLTAAGAVGAFGILTALLLFARRIKAQIRR